MSSDRYYKLRYYFNRTHGSTFLSRTNWQVRKRRTFLKESRTREIKEKAKRAYAYDWRSHCRRDWRATIERSIEAKNKSRRGKKRERNGEASFETRGKRRPRELILHIYTTFSKHCLIVHKRRREAGFLVPRSRNNYDWKRSDAKVNFTTALVRLIECLSDVKKKRGKKGKKINISYPEISEFFLTLSLCSLFVEIRTHTLFPNEHEFAYLR